MARPTDRRGNIIHFRPRSAAWADAYARFWRETLDQLAAYIQDLREDAMSDIRFEYPDNEPSMITSRSFDAPVALVWKVFTDPVHVVRWWGPKSIAPVKSVDKLELWPGGAWRFICERPDGSEQIIFAGKYLDVVAEQKLVNTFGVEGAFEGDENFPETHTFEERDGRTYYRSYTLLPSMEAREGVIASGMQVGAQDSMEQLGELVDQLAHEAA